MCFTAGSLAVSGKLQEGEAEKKKKLNFSQCTVFG